MNPIIKRFGDRIWYNDMGQIHREDGAAVEYRDGSRKWYIDGKLHREDGPAIENVNGDKQWYINGKRHRIDGPAIDYNSGYRLWWIDDIQIKCNNNEEFLRIVKLKYYM
jgi:hypothetical protein